MALDLVSAVLPHVMIVLHVGGNARFRFAMSTPDAPATVVNSGRCGRRRSMLEAAPKSLIFPKRPHASVASLEASHGDDWLHLPEFKPSFTRGERKWRSLTRDTF